VRPTVAVIPARGGSKRIEKKNITPFGGRPLMAWTIEAALECRRFDRVLVSTDDPEIASVAERHGASVPFIRNAHADDNSTVSLATITALEQLRDELGEEFETVVQLMANCPLRDAGQITAALDHFRSGDASAQISCFKFGWMNPWWAVTLSPEGRPTSLFPKTQEARSQDLPELYCPSGAIWIARVADLREHQTFYTPDRTFWVMPWQSAVDIDDAEDLAMADLLRAMRQGGS
jgi:N-acylneuraminate cytidylyltransferase